MPLKEQLAEYRAGWYQRVPAERQAIMQRHIDQLRSGAIARTMLKVGDQLRDTIRAHRKGSNSRGTAEARIQDVLEWAGVEFIDGDRPGVRMRRARS